MKEILDLLMQQIQIFVMEQYWQVQSMGMVLLLPDLQLLQVQMLLVTNGNLLLMELTGETLQEQLQLIMLQEETLPLQQDSEELHLPI